MSGNDCSGWRSKAGSMTLGEALFRGPGRRPGFPVGLTEGNSFRELGGTADRRCDAERCSAGRPCQRPGVRLGNAVSLPAFPCPTTLRRHVMTKDLRSYLSLLEEQAPAELIRVG